MIETPSSLTIGVSIVEDSDVYRELLANLCRSSQQLRLLAVCSSFEEACERLPPLNPDIVLVDLGLPDGDGAELIKCLRRARCRSECLVLTVYDDDRHLFPALEAGAVGYVIKDQTDEPTLLAAIMEAMQGGAPMSASIARRVLRYFSEKVAPRSAPSILTARENEIIEKLALGHSARKVAELLDISYHTVRCHQKNIYKKLHVGSVVEALAALNHLANPKRAAPTIAP